MNTLALAWRNLLRNRRRSLATLSAMVLGLVTVLLFGGYIKDLNYGLQTDFVQLSGHLQVQHRDYHLLGSGNPAAFGVRHHDELIQAIRTDPKLGPMVAVATPILQFGGLAGHAAAGVTRTVFVTGTVVEDQVKMRQWNEHRFPSLAKHNSLAGTPADTVVIGTGVARVLQLCGPLKVPDCPATGPDAGAGAGEALPDDIAALSEGAAGEAARPAAGARPRIEILTASARGAPNVAGVSVLAAEFQGIKELDDVHVAMHLSQAQQLVFGSAEPQVTAIALQLHSTGQLDAARSRLEALLKERFASQPLAVLDFATLNPFYDQALSMFAAIFGFIAVLIGSIVLFTVGNTMSTAVVERTAEIGTLRAIGLRRSGIRALFVCEGLLLGCIGAVLGTVAALVVAGLVNRIGLTWLPPGRVEPIELAVRVAGEPGMLAFSAVWLVVVGVLSALLPAARASRMNIVEALRHV
jgi:putative ABC transport system permease protein